jgi:hypothetical protein
MFEMPSFIKKSKKEAKNEEAQVMTIENEIAEIPSVAEEVISLESLEVIVGDFQESFKALSRLGGEEKSKFKEAYMFRLESAIGLIKHNHPEWVAKKRKLMDIRELLKRSN